MNRKEPKQASAEQQKYRSLFERNPDPTFYVDADGYIVEVNHAALKMAGVCSEDLVGLHINDLTPAEERPALDKRFARVRRGESLQYTLRTVSSDGQPNVLAITAIPVMSSGKFIGVHNVVQDVSDRVRAEQALQEQSATLAERVKELNCIKHLSEILEHASVLDEKLLNEIVNILPPGWQYPEITAARIVIGDIDVSTENYRKPRWRMTSPISVRGQQHGRIEIIYRKKMPERDEGPFLHEERDLLNIIADKLQRFYEQHLTAEEFRLSANAFKSTADAVMILDRDGKVVMVNPAYTQLSGYNAKDVLGVTLRHDPTNREQSVAHWFDTVEKQGGSLQGESWFRRKGGAEIPVMASISGVPDANGNYTHFVIIFRDLSAQRKVQERLDYLSFHDAQTNLHNRTYLAKEVPGRIVHARHKGRCLAIAFLDIDQFKHINDSIGRQGGDEVLAMVGRRLQSILPPGNIVARLGGDEFGILIDNLSTEADVNVVAADMINTFRKPFRISDKDVLITASLGIAVYPTDSAEFGELIHCAELAMYKAKRQGRVNYFRYSHDMQKVVSGERVLTLRTAMHQALERQEFHLLFQPIVDLENGRITGAEALIRWHSKELGIVPPSEFIPLAEETGLIFPIGGWVLNEAVRQTAKLVNAGHKDLRVAVNLSARQFQQSNLAQGIKECLQREGLAPGHLEVEITETMVMYGVDRTIKVLRDLHALGVSIALDDFGTGYSSLQYLKDFPIQYLKIDKSFVDGLPDGERDCAITKAIVGVAHGLDIKVTAEGVENNRQLAFLREIGCQEAQGYRLSVPLPSDELRQLLDNHAILPAPISDDISDG